MIGHFFVLVNNEKLRNERTCRDIKAEKAQKQDWDDTLATKFN